jgi:hypothetical protein
MPIVLKSGSLNLLQPSGPVQACNGIALPLQWNAVGRIVTEKTSETTFLTYEPLLGKLPTDVPDTDSAACLCTVSICCFRMQLHQIHWVDYGVEVFYTRPASDNATNADWSQDQLQIGFYLSHPPQHMTGKHTEKIKWNTDGYMRG